MNSGEILAVIGRRDIEDARMLFQEYAAALNISLCFQDFGEELANLPGHYAPPSGALLLARHDDRLAGCVALRDLKNGVCEMKRLYVRPEFRGRHIGRALAESILGEARRLQYRVMRLDTLATLTAALGLYERLGFRKVEAYYENPTPGVVYLEKILR